MDTVAGIARQIDPVTRQLSESGDRLELANGGRAIWTLSGGTLRLEAFDGTVLREWKNASPGVPVSSADGRVMLVPLQDGWYLDRGGVSQRVLPAVRGAEITSDGAWIAYLADTAIQGTYTVRVYEVATGDDRAVQDIRACSCGIILAVRWLASGQLAFTDFAVPGMSIGVSPGRSYLYDPRSQQATEIPRTATAPPSQPQPPSSRIDRGQGVCNGVLLIHPAVAAADACVLDAEIGAWSPDRTRVAYMIGGRLEIRDVISKQPTTVIKQVFGQVLWWNDPGIAWDASGRYLVLITD